MLGGLYGDLPLPSSDDHKNSSADAVWSTAAKFAPPTLRKPSSVSATQTLLKPKPFPPKSSPAPTPIAPRAPSPDGVARPANLVAVSSMIVDEYDPACPNDYEDYHREHHQKATEVEQLKELERRRIEDEERELWRYPSPPENSDGIGYCDGNGDGADGEGHSGGFSIGKSETVGLGVGGRWAHDSRTEDDGEDGVEERARFGEAGAGDDNAAHG